MTIKPGQSLGQYRVIEQIGKGGMATVFRATQPSLSREVAIKVLPDFFADDPAFHARFRQEAMAIAKLRHPNILTVFDSGEADGVAYIVTELVEGGTLADKLGKPLPLDYCVAIGTGVAAALDYAHARGMIHRDVKPSNVLLGTDGTPILSDFGLARMTISEANGARLTATGTALGTPEYMAPEQVASSTVGPAADVYALAVTLYEMLTGTVPYTADTPVHVIVKRMSEPLPLPRVRNPDLSEAVQSVLLKGLAQEPADRYQTAGEMARALDTAVRMPTAARPLPAPPAAQPSSPPRARSNRFLYAAAAALVVVGSTVFLVWGRTKASPPAAAAPTASLKDTNIGVVIPAATAGANPAPPAATPAVTPSEPPKTSRAATTGVAAAPSPTPAANARDPLPAHGRLLVSLATSAADMAAQLQPHAGDSTVVKSDGALELTAGSDSGMSARLPVDGIGDFVAVLRYVAVAGRPQLAFRFHQTPLARQGIAVKLQANARLSPAAAGAAAQGPHACCQPPFDVFLAPQVPGSQSLVTGAEPMSVAANANEEQVLVVSATRPLIVVYANGQEIARVTDSTLGPGGMTLGVWGSPRSPGTVRLLALDIYASASATTVAASELPPHGKLLYAMADHLPDVAQSRQMNPQNTLDIKGKSIELTAGAGQPGQPVSAEVQVSGISDFVAVMRIAATSHKPQLMFRFHRGPDGDHVVAIPAYLHLGPAAPGARAIDAHSCCQDLDVFTAPLGTGPTLYRAPQLLSVPASMGEELLVVVSVKGPLLVVHEGGQEIARVVFDSARPGGMLLQVQARGRVVPATLSLKSFEIYEAAPAR